MSNAFDVTNFEPPPLYRLGHTRWEFTQELHGAGHGNNPAELIIRTHDAGEHAYISLDASQFAMDSPEEIDKLAKLLKTCLIEHKKWDI